MKNDGQDTGVTLPLIGRVRTPSRAAIREAIATLQAALMMENVANPHEENEKGVPEQGNPDEQHAPTHAIGPGAAATGHGLAGGGVKPKHGPGGYREFIAALETRLGPEVWSRVAVTEQAAWVQIMGIRSGHRLYVAKTQRVVSRVECTLEPLEEEGRVRPDRRNGQILSWVVANEEKVAKAIETIATMEAPRAAGIR